MDQIQIINLGLGHISQQIIEDLQENSVQAEAANRVWEPCIKECLRGNNWPFATAIEALAEVANYTPPSPWKYAYAYPSTALAVWKVTNDYTDPTNKKGEDYREIYVPSLKIRVLLTNCQNAVGEYTYYVQDTSLYDASFVNALSYRLAAALAMPLNADPDLAINMTKIYQNQISEAQRIASYENNTANGESADSITNARVGGPGSNNSVSIGGQTFDQWNTGQ